MVTFYGFPKGNNSFESIHVDMVIATADVTRHDSNTNFHHYTSLYILSHSSPPPTSNISSLSVFSSHMSVIKRVLPLLHPFCVETSLVHIPACSLVSRPPGERTSGVLIELSRHRHLSPLEFQMIQSECSF